MKRKLLISLTHVYSTGIDKGLNDALTHAGNAIVNFCDLFVVAYPSRFGHFVYPLSGGLLYTFIFMLPYSLAGGQNRHGHPYIYKVADWRGNPKGAIIFTLGTLTFLTIMHFILTSLAKLRERIHKRMNDKKNEKTSMSNFDNPSFNAI